MSWAKDGFIMSLSIEKVQFSCLNLFNGIVPLIAKLLLFKVLKLQKHSILTDKK